MTIIGGTTITGGVTILYVYKILRYVKKYWMDLWYPQNLNTSTFCTYMVTGGASYAQGHTIHYNNFYVASTELLVHSSENPLLAYSVIKLTLLLLSK